VEAERQDSTVVLVAHGDTLSITTAAVRDKLDMCGHKTSFYLGTAEFMKL